MLGRVRVRPAPELRHVIGGFAENFVGVALATTLQTGI